MMHGTTNIKFPLHVSGTYVPIFRRTDYTYTATASTSSLMTTVPTNHTVVIRDEVEAVAVYV